MTMPIGALDIAINLLYAVVKIIQVDLLLAGHRTHEPDFACPHIDFDIVRMRNDLRAGYSELGSRASPQMSR
jgi:hypothetical protein